MINLLLTLAVSVLAAAVTPAPHGRQFSAAGRQFVLVPQTGQLFRLNADGSATRLRASYVYEDSKAAAFHLDRGHILKLFTGPGYQDGGWKLEQSKINQMGRREAAILNGWAKNGLAMPVTEQGTTPDGVFYSVVEKPKRSVSGTHLVKTGRGAELNEKMQRLAQALAGQRWQLGTFNPTQVVVERGGQARALLIKSYISDRVEAAKDEQELRGYYDAQAREFTTLADIYGAIRAQGPPLSDGKRVTETSAIRRLIAQAYKDKRDIRIVYKKSDKDKATMFHARILPGTFNGRDNHFLKGYVHLEVFPESGKPNRYTFRIDKILEAEFLDNRRQQRAQAAPLTDDDVWQVAAAAGYDKGLKRYRRTVRRAEAYLKGRGATDAQLTAFREHQEKHARPVFEKEIPRGAVTDAEVDAAVKGVISMKGRPWSQTEFNAAYYTAAWSLWEKGASFEQMLAFHKAVDEAPVKGGSFNPWSGD